MAGVSNSYHGITLPLRSQASQLSGEKTTIAKMEQIIFWAARNERSLPSSSLQAFQTSVLCYAKFFLLLHAVAKSLTLSHLKCLCFLGDFLCLGLPGATWQAWLRYATLSLLCPSQLPSGRHTCLPIHPLSTASASFSQNNSQPTIHSHLQSWLSPHHCLLEASSIHRTQNVHKQSHSPFQPTSSTIEKNSVAFTLPSYRSKTRHWWER